MHAVELLTDIELAEAEAAYCFYGLREVAFLLVQARSLFEAGNDLGDHEMLLDSRYAEFIPTDHILSELFEARLKSNPSEYAPLRPQDVG